MENNTTDLILDEYIQENARLGLEVKTAKVQLNQKQQENDSLAAEVEQLKARLAELENDKGPELEPAVDSEA